MCLKNSKCAQQIKIICNKMTRHLRDIKKQSADQNPISKSKKTV